MERFTNIFTIPQHLLASTPRLDRSRHLLRGLAAALGTLRPTAVDRVGRSIRRRDVQSCKKGGADVGKTKRGKGTKLMLLVDGEGIPLAADICSASPAEVTRIEPLLEKQLLPETPDRLIYDMAADSDPLRERLNARQIELICPHRSNRVKPPTQDGRKLRRYARRFKVERTISWLFNHRRLVVRYEHHSHLFFGFVQLACMFTLLMRL